MNLIFPDLNGGQFQGLNDAGVENFQGAIDFYLSRECGQNTCDAIRSDASIARLTFERIEVPQNQIPAFDQLKEVLPSCLEQVQGKGKETDFFEQAILEASKETISVLKISDYGTTGLTGNDLEKNGRWFALVKSQGVTNKNDTEGGSFGIGKSSPFAASSFRTVFYSTRTETGSVAVQGVSRLMSHINRDGKETQGTGFIGEYDPSGGTGGSPVFCAIRNEERIPKLFRRTEPGTDIWVIGYRSGAEWQNELTRSIITNFWPSIYFGNIEFEVGPVVIGKDNLPDLIASQVGVEGFEAHLYHAAIQSQPLVKTLKYTGTCELYLTTSSPDLPRKICMVRKTGMRIYDYPPRSCRIPFSGLFICTDPEGNKLLRRLEPPKHDTWDPMRSEDGLGKKALDEIKLWIREEVKKLNPYFAGDSFNESEAAKYLPDEADDSSDLPDDDSGDSNEESLISRPSPNQPKPTPTPARPAAMQSGQNDPAGGPTNPNSKTKGGKSGGGGSGTPGNGNLTNEAKAIPVQTRSFKSGTGDSYTLVLRSNDNLAGTLLVKAVGEDGFSEAVQIISAETIDSPIRPLIVSNANVSGIELKADIPLRIRVKLQALERRSLTALLKP